jgi:NifU-like protein involved in Fe-S cluster formation
VIAGPYDPLAPRVRRLFAALVHAGDTLVERDSASGGRMRRVSGEAGREHRGTRVRFTLQLDGLQLLEARYRAYGCPYTLAACEWLAQRLESGERQLIGGPADWARQLQIPPARMGRLLVVEDALRAALAAADKTVTDS